MNHSSFYQKHFAASDSRNFFSLPTINKSIMMEHLSEINTVGLSKKEMIDFCLQAEATHDFSKRLRGFNVGMSSGTSGNKGIEIASQREENLLKAAFFARFDFPRREKINMAFMLRVNSPAFSFNRFGHRLTYFSQLDTIEHICSQLQALQPNIISVPPSMLSLIAREMEEKRLSISPKRIISYAEVLYPHVRHYLKSIFQCPVHEIYKCSEGAIAISCRYEKLHINEDLVFVELYDVDGQPSKPGEPCYKMLITDLHKTSLPIIRYELNDIITISPEPCACGSHFRVIENIQGRSDDLFWGIGIDDRKIRFINQDYITRGIISASDDVVDFQAIQNDYHRIQVRIIPSAAADRSVLASSVENSIRNVFAQYRCEEPHIEVIFTEPVPHPVSLKLSRVICNIHHDTPSASPSH